MDRHIICEKELSGQLYYFCICRFVWITAGGKNCLRVRYCERSHSPHTLECSHGDDK